MYDGITPHEEYEKLARADYCIDATYKTRKESTRNEKFETYQNMWTDNIYLKHIIMVCI